MPNMYKLLTHIRSHLVIVIAKNGYICFLISKSEVAGQFVYLKIYF